MSEWHYSVCEVSMGKQQRENPNYQGAGALTFFLTTPDSPSISYAPVIFDSLQTALFIL